MGGAATLSSHLPEALPRTHTRTHIHNDSDATPEGDLPLLRPRRHLQKSPCPAPPSTPAPALGKGIQSRARGGA